MKTALKENEAPEDAVRRVLKNYQQQKGLKPTGHFDLATLMDISDSRQAALATDDDHCLKGNSHHHDITRPR